MEHIPFKLLFFTQHLAGVLRQRYKFQNYTAAGYGLASMESKTL